MQKTEIDICSIGLFGDGVKHFWMDNVAGLLEKYPQLEFPHKQNFYTLLFIEKADGHIVIDNYNIRLDSPKIIIIKPRCVYSININRHAVGKILCFTEDFFSLRYNNNILYQFHFLKVDTTPYIRLNLEQNEHWQTLNKLITNEFELKKRETQKVLRSYLNIILFELERLYKPLGNSKNKNPKIDKISQFEELINNHFQSNKLPSYYADLLNVSPNYLNKICKEETGQTAGDLIRKRIIIEAQRLLHYTNYNISEIAYKLGFENASYFVTFFKKITGLTPDQFRKTTNS
jgi:AraC family transcriptional activator of pobA